jgi:hypothetical protein
MNISLADHLQIMARPRKRREDIDRPSGPKLSREEWIRAFAEQGIPVHQMVERLFNMGLHASEGGIFSSMERWGITNGETAPVPPEWKPLPERRCATPSPAPGSMEWAGGIPRPPADHLIPREEREPRAEGFVLGIQEVDPRLDEKEMQWLERSAQALALEKRRKLAFDLLNEGHGITAAAKGSGSQVNQLYGWIKKYGAAEGLHDETQSLRETDAFQDHVQDRLSDGANPLDIRREYGLSDVAWKRLEKLHANKAILQLPAIAEVAEIKAHLPRDFRYPDDIPVGEGIEKLTAFDLNSDASPLRDHYVGRRRGF